MIPERFKDTVFFSSLFAKDYSDYYKEIKAILDANGVMNGLLTNTKDYWCRDFMPVQVGDGEFVRFVYDPDYLKGKERFKTDSSKVKTSLSIKMKVREVGLVVDGGNLVPTEDGRILMTDKVLSENQMDEKEIREKLSASLNSDIVLVPWLKNDPCGHTDGMVRPIGNNRLLLISDMDMTDANNKEIENILTNAGFETEWIFLESKDDVWAYCNFLQTNKAIIVPGLGIKEDDIMLKRIKSLFPEYGERVYQVKMPDIIHQYGGALNCLTWTVCQDYLPYAKAKPALLETKNKEILEREVIQDGPAFIARIKGLPW